MNFEYDFKIERSIDIKKKSYIFIIFLVGNAPNPIDNTVEGRNT